MNYEVTIPVNKRVGPSQRRFVEYLLNADEFIYYCQLTDRLYVFSPIELIQHQTACQILYGMSSIEPIDKFEA